MYTPPRSTMKSLGNPNVFGNLELVVNNTITRPTPWESPVPVHNPNTSYGMSYNPEYGKSSRIKLAGKQVLDKNCLFGNDTKNQAAKLHKSTKPLRKTVDFITGDVALFGRKISPLQLNSKLEFREDMFSKAETKEFSPNTSKVNMEWLAKQEKVRNLSRLSNGEVIPSMNQLQLYGRRAEKSKFEQRKLWG